MLILSENWIGCHKFSIVKANGDSQADSNTCSLGSTGPVFPVTPLTAAPPLCAHEFPRRSLEQIWQPRTVPKINTRAEADYTRVPAEVHPLGTVTLCTSAFAKPGPII